MSFLKLHNKNSNKKGFTIVELLVYMGLLGFVLLTLTQIFTTILSTQLESEANSSVQQDGNYILSRLFYDINRAETIDFPINPGDQETTLTLTIDGDSHTYSLAGGRLIVVNSGGQVELSSYDTVISSLSFQRLGSIDVNNSITISFTLTSVGIKEGGQTESRNFQTTAVTR